ncbi:MAG: universal stress protein [Solirubrobacteraceae bacterium]|nr:universal stress protein [Solirubrobacteraceae bacterium]
MATQRTIVVGYDDSPASRAAVAQAVSLADGGEVVLVHAREAAPPRMSSRWQELLAAHDPSAADEVFEAIALEANGPLRGATWSGRVVEGAPAEAIVAVAREVDADLIVVGSRGYGSLGPHLGSVSARVLAQADRPVVVLPPAAIG